MEKLKTLCLTVAYITAYRILLTYWFIVRPSTHGSMVALWHQRELLVVKTTYRKWTILPGGTIEKNEDSLSAAIRELKEEINFTCDPSKLTHAWTGTLKMDFRDDTVDIWRLELLAKPEITINPGEISYAKWVTLDEALKLPLFPHVREYLSQLG